MKKGKYLHENEFESAMRHGVVLLDFNASWCAPCRVQEPIIRQLARKFENQAMVTSLNIDANRETALKLCIHSIPTLVLFKNGKEIQRFIGLQSEKLLSQAIENVLG
ncbi:MAG: thioredoxin domain-containing protein [Desulfobacterales bacterium]|jgi:thioredoxin 1